MERKVLRWYQQCNAKKKVVNYLERVERVRRNQIQERREMRETRGEKTRRKKLLVGERFAEKKFLEV